MQKVKVYIMISTYISYLFNLAHCIVDKTTSFGAVMKREACAGFVFTEKGRSSHPRVRELEKKS